MTDVAGFREAIGHFATGLAIVTAPGPAGATTNAVTSLSLDPLLVLACLDRGSRTLDAIRASGRAGISVLAAEQEDVARGFASKASHAEKFATVSHRDDHGVPLIDGAIAWLAGPVHQLMPGGDHEIVVIAVEAYGAPGGEPLLFHRGAYGALPADSGA
ncbi:MAG: flavin reductase family protein [Thermoleophilaceae bacterium]|nr:flavin reductase family protein [Thermoleophilaceae bacterium]